MRSLVSFLALVCFGLPSADDDGAPVVAGARHPIAAGFLADGEMLVVANGRSGSVALVDWKKNHAVTETVVGRHLTSLVVIAGGKRLLVTDDERQELIDLAVDGARVTVRSRIAVGPYPAGVAVAAHGRRALVASTWSRRVDVVDLAAGRVVQSIRLPIAPRECLPLPGDLALVADAFGGHLAVVDPGSGRVVAIHEIIGHNLRGLTLDANGTHVIVAHQILDQHAPTTRSNVQNGVIMANVLRVIPVAALTRSGTDVEAASRLVRLGVAAGDPAGVAVLDDGRLAVSLAGVDAVALVSPDGSVERRTVGRRPTALVGGQGGRLLVVLNTLGDSLTVFAADQAETLALAPPHMPTPQERGERLFFDARLSVGGSMSCHSCHTDGHTNGLLADTLGDGTYGTPKRTLTLRGTALSDPWGWNGGFKYLHDQVERSLVDTMHTPGVTPGQLTDVVSFLHTLPPPPPAEPATADPADRARVEHGRQIFTERGCVRCHIPPLVYSAHETHDVGFADERGLRQFNPPSLRGVGQGYHFLHDNRARSLDEVFTTFRHKAGDLSNDDRNDLLRFLRSL